MPPPAEHPDPLLDPLPGAGGDGGPARAPIGNSIRTLLLFGALAALGLVVWWIVRPSDVTRSIGARQWIIVDVDGEPATSPDGLASTFVLDGTGEVRAAAPCATRTGRWSVDGDDLVIAWDREPFVPDVPCPPDAPPPYQPVSGRVSLDGSVMTVRDGDRMVRAVSPAEDGAVDPAELAGRWAWGETEIEIGARGLLQIGECRGSWTADEPGIVPQFDADELARPACQFAAIWRSPRRLLLVRHDDTLFVRRDLTSFPLDRQVHRLDLVRAADAPPVRP